jgi:hypothetical protein
MHTTKSEKIILILIFPFLVSIFLFSKNASSPDLTGWVLIPGESNSKGLFSRRVYGNISGVLVGLVHTKQFLIHHLNTKTFDLFS